MDKPDKIDELTNMYDGVILHIHRHTNNIISFQKTHDFQIEYWYLTYPDDFAKDPLCQRASESLIQHIELNIDNTLEIDIDHGRILWDALLNNGWVRSSQEDIDKTNITYNLGTTSISGGLTVMGDFEFNLQSSVSADVWQSPSIQIGNGIGANLSIDDKGKLTITDENGKGEEVDILGLKKELDKLKKEVQCLKQKKAPRRIK